MNYPYFFLEENRYFLMHNHLPYECQNWNEKCLKWVLVWYLRNKMLIRDSPWVWLHQNCWILLLCVRVCACAHQGIRFHQYAWPQRWRPSPLLTPCSPRLSSVWFFLPFTIALFSATITPLVWDREICNWKLSWRVLGWLVKCPDCWCVPGVCVVGVVVNLTQMVTHLGCDG